LEIHSQKKKSLFLSDQFFFNSDGDLLTSNQSGDIVIMHREE